MPRIRVRQTLKHFDIMTYSAKWWLEVKSRGSNKSEKRFSTPQNIENAFVQVIKGIEGFAREQLKQRNKNAVPSEVLFIPVVVTTAELYVAAYEPKDIDLRSGRIDKEKIWFGQGNGSAEEVPWMQVDYAAGENVVLQPIHEHDLSTYPRDLQKYKMRSILVANSKNIEAFFSRLTYV